MADPPIVCLTRFRTTVVPDNSSLRMPTIQCPMSIFPTLGDDFQALVDSLLSFAKSTISENGSFNPFGAVMYPDGSIQWVAVDAGEEFPSSQVLIDGMTEIFKGMAESGGIRAATICFDAFAIPPGETLKVDVIGFALEARSGNSISAYLPYKRREHEEVECGELFTLERLPQFFAEPSTLNGS